MHLLTQTNMSSKIVWGYLFLLAIIFFLVIFSTYQLERVNFIATEIEENWLPATRTLGDINKGLSDLRIAEYQIAVSTSSTDIETLLGNIQKTIQTIQDEQAIYEDLIITEEEKKYYDIFCQKWEAYRTENRKIQNLSRDNHIPDALAILNGPSHAIFQEMSSLMEHLININEKGGIETSHRGDSIYTLSSLQIISLGIFALIVGITICIIMSYFLITTASVTRKYKFISSKR